MTNENIIRIETNASVLEQENIQETLEIPRHSTECDFLCSNLKGLPHLSPQKHVGTEGDIIGGQYSKMYLQRKKTCLHPSRTIPYNCLGLRALGAETKSQISRIWLAGVSGG